MNRFCTQCGKRLTADNIGFCAECGAKVERGLEFSEPDVFIEAPESPPANTESPTIIFDISHMKNNIKPVENDGYSDGYNEGFSDRFSDDSILVDLTPIVHTQLPIDEGSTSKRVFVTLASVLVAIVLTVVISAGQSLYVLKKSINAQTVSTIAKTAFNDVDLSTFPVSDLVNIGGINLPGVEADDDDTLSDVIYGAIDNYYIETFGVEEKHVQQILEHEMFRTFFSDILEGGIDYITGGDDKEIITSNRIVNLIEENSKDIEEITSYKLVQTDYDDIRKILSESGIDGLTWGSAIDNISDAHAIRNSFSAINRYSTLAMTAGITTSFLLFMLLLALNRRRISAMLLYVGIPCLVSGGMFIIGSFITGMVFRRISNTFGIAAPAAVAIENALSVPGNVILFTGLAVFGTGMVCVIVKLVVNATARRSL